MNLTFLGGARAVTGAQYLIETDTGKFLVDCGMTQGGRFIDDKNAAPFAFNPSEIDAVFLTHAHIDHCGLLPKLVKQGFTGPIYTTEPTIEIAHHLLHDSAKVMYYHAKDDGDEPIYTSEDVDRTKHLYKPIPYKTKRKCKEGISVEFFNAGHILGSASIRLTHNGTSVVFSGDLGSYRNTLLDPFELIPTADYVLIESTYGGRVHESYDERVNVLEDVIEKVYTDKGTLIIPSFALERAQELLFDLNFLIENNKIPRLPIFIDSPLAITFTKVYKKYKSYFKASVRKQIGSGDDIFDFPGLKLSETKQQSKKINTVKPPKIIIAGSGMSNGGRVLYHEEMYLPDPASALLLVGYQAEGTIGRDLFDRKPFITIRDRHVTIRADIEDVSGYSGHPDQPALLDWIKGFNKKRLKKVFSVQGEEDQARALAEKITSDLGIEAVLPKPNETVELI